MWPPNIERGWSAANIKGDDHTLPASCTKGLSAGGLFGGPTQVTSWGDWISSYYHEMNQTKYSNIVWSNGALDPWSGGGHYSYPGGVVGPPVQNLTADGSSVALPIPLGGHHVDLMFPTPEDPPCVVYARQVEEAMIRRWASEHYIKYKHMSN